MQTLSLKTSQSAQKNLSDVASKNQSNVNNLASDAEKTPFRMELTKQIQAKKPAQQPSHVTRPVQNKVAQNTQVTAQKANDKQVASLSDEAALKADKVSKADSVQSLLGLQAADQSIDINSLSELKEEKEIKPEGVVVNQDVNIATLAGLLMPVSNSKLTSEVASALDEQATLLNDSSLQSQSAQAGAGSPQKSLDTLLGNALSQSKSGQFSTPDKNATDASTGQSSEQTRWLDEMLDTSQPKVVAGDAAPNKAITNVLTDIVNKEMTAMPSHLPQPQLSQVNSTLAAQQMASSNTINAYPGKAGWDQAISQKIVWMVGTGEQTASLTLNPPDLGPLKVVIHVHNDQADTTFISDNDEVRQALENGLSNLRDKMNESGIALGQTNVSTSNQSQQNFQQAAQSRTLGQAQNSLVSSQTETVANTQATVRVSNGLVDTFA